MLQAIRSQADDLQDEISDATGLDTGTETLTRQEFKDEADLNILLSRFGANAMSRQPEWGGETDFTLDLQGALAAIAQAKEADLQVPPELREKYPTWRDVLNGAETGEYQTDLKMLAQVKANEQRRKTHDEALEKATQDLMTREKAERYIRRMKEDSAAEQTPNP